MLYSLLIACILLLCSGLILPLKKYLRALHLSKQFPGPKTIPLLGNAHLFFNLSAAEIWLKMYHIMKTYGNTLSLWILHEYVLIMSDVKDLKVVLGTTRFIEKSEQYSLMRPWLHEGLLTSKRTKWLNRRKVLTPAFHFKILEQFIDIFDKESSILIKNLKADMQRTDEIYMEHWITLATLDVICESAMGVSVNAQTNADSEYVKAVQTILTVMHKRMFDILYRFDLTYKFTQLACDEKKALAVLHGFTEKIIVQRREELLKNQLENSKDKKEEDDVGAKRKMTFLDILLQSEIDGKPLSNLDIREEVDTFMFGGHDTVSSALTFFFYNVSLNPKCQQKCFEEIQSVLGKDNDRPVNNEALKQLHYVEMCIKETLRMFPSAPLLGRKVTQECEINGKIIPAGTNIGISPLHLGRMEEFFPEPNSFKPERFDVETSAERLNPYTYIPFSAGPRNCIGQKYAMLEMKTMVTNVLRHFELEYAGNSSEEPLLIAELILRTKDPLMFKLKPRVY